MKVFSRFGIFFLSFLIVVLSLELALNLFNFESEYNPPWQSSQFYNLDKELIYRLSPNRSSPHPEDYWATDSNAFRYNPLHNESKINTKKIFIIGDSFAYGHGVTHNQSYPYYLERSFSEIDENIQVINAGVPGYGPDQEFIYLNKEIIPKFSPDIVIWTFTLNDLTNSNEECLFVDIFGRYVQLSGSLNFLYAKQYYPSRLPQFIQQSKILEFILAKLPDVYTPFCTKNNYTNEEFSTKIDYFLKISKEKLAEQNSRLVVLVALDKPSLQYLLEGQKDLLWTKELRELFKKDAENNQIPFMDVNDFIVDNNYQSTINQESQEVGMSSAPIISRYFLPDEKKYFSPHLNPLGNKVMADAASLLIQENSQ